MIKNHDRSGWIGASDTAMVMGSWETESFRKWWAVKLGIREETFHNAAMDAGTAYEHKILDALNVKTRDRQIRIPDLKLRVNYDGEDGDTITEVKTHSKPVFKVTKPYWMQCQVEMFASGHGLLRQRKKCRIAAYQIGESELLNHYLPVDPERITIHPVEYDPAWVVQRYLPRLRYLAHCLKTGRYPKKEEIPRE